MPFAFCRAQRKESLRSSRIPGTLFTRAGAQHQFRCGTRGMFNRIGRAGRVQVRPSPIIVAPVLKLGSGPKIWATPHEKKPSTWRALCKGELARVRSWSELHPGCSRHHRTQSGVHATSSLSHATSSSSHATCSLSHATSSSSHATCSLSHATRGSSHATSSSSHATSSLFHAIGPPSSHTNAQSLRCRVLTRLAFIMAHAPLTTPSLLSRPPPSHSNFFPCDSTNHRYLSTPRLIPVHKSALPLSPSVSHASIAARIFLPKTASTLLTASM